MVGIGPPETETMMMIQGIGEMMGRETNESLYGRHENVVGTIGSRPQIAVGPRPKSETDDISVTLVVTDVTVLKKTEIERIAKNGRRRRSLHGWRLMFLTNQCLASLGEVPPLVNWMVFRHGKRDSKTKRRTRKMVDLLYPKESRLPHPVPTERSNPRITKFPLSHWMRFRCSA
jgi:hypothetical protein